MKLTLYIFFSCLPTHFLVKFQAVKAAIDYLKEVRFELSKVVWPKRQEVIKLTLIVLIISAIVGIYVGGLDYLFTKTLEFILAR